MFTKSHDSYARRCDRLNNLFLAAALLVVILAAGMIYMDSNHSLFTQNPQVVAHVSSVPSPSRWVDAVTPRSDSSRIGRVSVSEIDENLEVSLGAQRASFKAAMAQAKAARQ